MNYGFFDMNLMGITRYPSLIAHEILNQKNDSSFFFFYEQEGSLSEEEALAILPVNSKLIKVQSISGYSIKRIIAQSKIKILTVMAQRIPDTAFVLGAKESGVYTIMFQHGLYIPFIKRETSLLIHQVKKVFRFVCYVNAVASLVDKNFIATLYNYIQVFIFGKNIKQTSLPYQKLNADHVLVYGDYWKQYHKDVFGYALSQQDVVGYPELKSLTNENENISAEGVCYITQTLVEDGRLARKILIDFMKALSQSCQEKKLTLTIKLHPRSDLTLYKELAGVVVFEKKRFPISDLYVGHYSSLVAKAAFITNNILLIDFPGHDIPEYIKSISSHRFNYNEVAEFTEILASKNIKSEKIISENKAKLKNIFGEPSLDPVQNVATYIQGHKC